MPRRITCTCGWWSARPAQFSLAYHADTHSCRPAISKFRADARSIIRECLAFDDAAGGDCEILDRSEMESDLKAVPKMSAEYLAALTAGYRGSLRAQQRLMNPADFEADFDA